MEKGNPCCTFKARALRHLTKSEKPYTRHWMDKSLQDVEDTEDTPYIDTAAKIVSDLRNYEAGKLN